MSKNRSSNTTPVEEVETVGEVATEEVVEVAHVQDELETEQASESIDDEVNPDGLVTFKVLHPVLGYKPGDTFKATLHEVRFQLKHKSVEVA